ncbi:MAG TPA: xanthine dehydrogenase family protein molybdopterin-binding subunit [Burkholderiales bacterium]|nr:xanthine dehydrogenase family protein molybdopterin-binding subunit [Burkholderiales bacterium]
MTGIGAPVGRPDGAAKVTGRAKYAGEEMPAGTLHAVLVTSTIASGVVTDIDAGHARRVAGVVRVLTHESLPKLAPAPVPPAAQSFMPMQDNRVMYEGQPVAIVLAETLEAANEGAGQVKVTYRAGPLSTFAAAESVKPRSENNGYAFAEIETRAGQPPDPSQVKARIDETYSTATRHHNPMEPSTTLAEWRGDEISLHDATQWTYGIRYALAAMLGIEPRKIHVRCPYTGGGFGCKGYVWPHQVLAVLSAKVVGRPVRLNLTRQGMYTGSGYQPEVVNRVQLAADAGGRLLSIVHDSTNVSSLFDDYVEFGAAGTRGLYASGEIATSTKVRHCNAGTPTAMRAPHEGPGLFALESAMDELAAALDLDPLELRLRNYAEVDPADGRPFSSKKLRDAYLEAARRFGWEKRPARPRMMREGHWLIGWGMASCIMSTFRFASSARVRMRADGTVTIETGTQEIGTGPYTVMPQIAAEVLGVPLERVKLILGSTDLPETGGTFGSSTTLSTGSAVKDACEKLKPKLPLLEKMSEISADGVWKPHGDVGFDATGGKSGYSMHTWGAVFAEVAIDESLGLVRLRRAVGGYSAGRIINPRTARSQMIGGIVWGYGQAVLEESVMDARYGRYLSKNLSGVMLPVNADIPTDIDVFFVEEHDPHASAIGARGIGELGATGVSAAIANAVWHATGKRIRKLPIRLSDVIA